jgi:hypothetical protein
MRRTLAIGLALVFVACCAFDRRVHAQGDVRQGVPAISRPYTTVRSPEANLLRPYGSRDGQQYFTHKRTYTRPPVVPPPPPIIPARASVFARGVHDYYPAARPGQGKNQNVVDPRTLCVPGRRALLRR